MLSNLYAYNAYYYFFIESNDVCKIVLPSFTNSECTDIITDGTYGMNSPRMLITWVVAADGDGIFTVGSD